MTIKETAEVFPTWERALKVDLYKKIVDWNLAKGIPEETSKVIAAQGVNYITGEDWGENLQSATEEIKKTFDKHKSEIIPFVKAMLETDKMCREVVVNYLRIKSVLMFAAEGASSEEQKGIEMTDEELRLLNVTRDDFENSKKMFGGFSSKWMKNPMKERIEKILLTYGPEFPEEVDLIKFDKLILDFHRTIFPKKE